MDILSVIGIFLGMAAILGGNFLEGGELDSLLNGPAMVIVLGGTLGAMFLQFPPSVFFRALRIALWVFFPKLYSVKKQITQIRQWGMIARKEGLLGLDSVAAQEKDPFIKKGLMMLIDGNEPQALRDSMELEINVKEYRDLQAAKLFEAMGGYSPTIGILGAVMGLIHVMQNLSDPSKLGSGIATAFVATIYGVGLANLLFLPIANKLRARVHGISQNRELIVEGLTAIAEGDNPKNIELRLSGFLREKF
ncbi:MAG: flagellar motor protein [Methylococcaceae bacterium]